MPITTDVLLDTNILLRTQLDKPTQLTNATRALITLRRAGARLVTTVQNLAEFVNVSTRPESDNGYGLPLEEVLLRIQYFEIALAIASESPNSYHLWKNLLVPYEVRGKQVHDARLVSVMLDRGIKRILTFNTRHFIRFHEVEALHPDQVLEDEYTH